MNGISQAVKGSRLLANAVGLSDSDSEPGQSHEGGADADADVDEADQLLAAVNGSDEEELNDEQLEQVSIQVMTLCAVLSCTILLRCNQTFATYLITPLCCSCLWLPTDF